MITFNKMYMMITLGINFLQFHDNEMTFHYFICPFSCFFVLVSVDLVFILTEGVIGISFRFMYVMMSPTFIGDQTLITGLTFIHSKVINCLIKHNDRNFDDTCYLLVEAKTEV